MGAAALAVIGLGASAYSAYAQHRQASADQEAAEEAADFNSRVLAEQSAVEEARRRRLARRELAAQRTAYAKAGVQIEGSPLEVLASNAGLLERDILEGKLEARRGIQYQGLQRSSAQAVGRSRRVAAGASLLAGAGQAAGTYYSLGGFSGGDR